MDNSYIITIFFCRRGESELGFAQIGIDDLHLTRGQVAVVGAVVGTVEFIEQPLGTMEVAVEHAQCTLRGGLREIESGKCGLVHRSGLSSLKIKN